MMHAGPNARIFPDALLTVLLSRALILSHGDGEVIVAHGIIRKESGGVVDAMFVHLRIVDDLICRLIVLREPKLISARGFICPTVRHTGQDCLAICL